ncbi:MAG: hypothetical protein A2805_04060 [Candidatus Andersenbacteria bacterium RIFCSPHIGHO2_01_FULL_46_36]|uniref:Kynurenine formamidase n=1 Tax=Candidatus Andersenbacteria bacterium RIFCSPHIGHO2_12_FULL_45_11 TaxID=1797281 RepID=A0A1G1X3F2_9BACT|nr:MAG: hypothetical protein A2805_04060 [Candidatus Andersenbacteria bacterium RIFCSPHIGHO2_01_FULL_46_36]OGY33867.1 MAG: hypothetical protein A3D99_03980 [Candidatus Andersenbacteria bacterium RIFCSPHIGHO2_12_FULL_45_11]
MLIDISRPIHAGMAIYPNNPGVSIRNIQKATDGASALSEITIGSHTGTHIDALSHIDPMGSGVDTYSLDQLVGACDVIEIAHDVSVIHEVDLSQTTTPRVLIKTRNSSMNPDEFDADFVALAEDAAQELMRRGVRLVGIDALSIKKKGVKDRVHEIFLRAGVCILEGLYLADAPAGCHELFCLPLPLVGIDGVPARAILRI